MSPLRVFTFCVAFGLVPLVSNRAKAQEHPSAAQKEADALFQQGYDAIVAQDWQNAQTLLTRAWELERRPEIAGLLGQTERKLCAQRKDGSFCSLYLDAARHLDFALRNMSENTAADPGARSRLEGWLADTRMRIGALSVEAPHGSAITVDGHPIGTAPLPSDVFVEPGKHVVAVSKDGSAKSENVDVHRGERLRVVLQPEQPNPTGTSRIESQLPPKGEKAQRQSRSFVPIYVLGGVAVGAVGTAVVLNILKVNDEEDFNALKDEIPPLGCAEGRVAHPKCGELKDAAERHDAKLKASWVAWGIAGAATVAAATYFLWPRSEKQQRDVPVRAALSVGRTSGELLLSGSF